MEVKGNSQGNTRKSSYALFAFSLLAGLVTALCFQLGLLIIPVCASSLAALFLSERREKRVLSYIAPPVIIIFDVVFNSIYSFNCLASFLVALIIYFCYTKERSKSECAVYSTILISVFTVLSFVLAAFFLTETFSFEAVASFYEEQFLAFKEEFLLILEQLSADGALDAELFTDEYVSDLFVSVYNSFSSLIAVFAFVICGLSLKLFSVMKKYTLDNTREGTWFFGTTSLFAYFYIALVILSFLIAPVSFFGIFVANLHSVFMFVYAYVGYKFVSFACSSRGMFTKLLLIAAIVFFSGVAVQILSYIGVYLTIVSGRIKGMEND